LRIVMISTARDETMWLRLDAAARMLALTPAALRARILRCAVSEDGGVVARPGLGFEARKLGRHWRVRIAP
jgi:hypothetical protein